MTRNVSVLGLGVCITLLFAAGASSCSSDPAEIVEAPASDAGFDASGGRPQDAAGGAPSDAAIPDANADGSTSDAGVAAVRLGVVPIARNDPSSSAAEETVANLEVLSAGSRAVSVLRRWDALYTTAEQATPKAWTLLGELAQLYRGRDGTLLLCLGIVDRTLDARPEGLVGEPWNGAQTLAAGETLLDEVFDTYGSELAYLSLGHEVDRYLGAAPTSERAELTELLVHLLGYAHDHPARPEATQLGVTFTLQALREGMEQPELLAASDAVITTYFPATEDFQARPASVVTQDLDALNQRLSADIQPAPPVVLQAVGYPSSELVGSSEANQRTFFANLFQVLAARRARYPFVSIHGLNDTTAEQCSHDALGLGVQGSAVEGAVLEYRCSLGLRDGDTAPKAAWAEVVGGLATFASP